MSKAAAMLLSAQILAVVGSAVFAGVMIAIGLILGPYWRSLPPAEFVDWFRVHSPLIQRVIPLVVVPTLAGLAGATWLSWSNAAARPWWLGAVAGVAAVLVLTAMYFLPLNARFSAGSIPLAAVPSALRTWLAVHWIRIALGLTAAASGLVATTR